ncbi:glycosyl hydrolase [Halolamina litorea]|uniref:WD40/YVTN/BNR-like repeat-containing protein n=1 Tax=Halolamina litorea TaxID=1515593 RepID=A0ABD6BNN7_9EURY|nr:hypothetical protein [Halolamina litorea]
MSTIYAAYGETLLVVDGAGDAADAGGSPTLQEHRFDSRTQSVAVTDGTVLLGTFEDGLQRSTDGGDSWERATGIEHDAVTAIAAAPDDPATVYAGTEPSRFYRSTDGGATFERLDGLTDLPSSDDWAFPPRPHTHHVRWIEPDPADPDLLHVSIEAGAQVRARLTDDGVDWEDRVPGTRRDVHTMATHPATPGRVWVAAGDGYAETADGGDSWEHPQSGLNHTYCWSVAVDPAGGVEPSTPRVLLSAASGANDAHRRGESYLYRREGDAWERLDGRGVPTGEGVYRAVLARGADEGTFWAANNHGLYRTDDGGDTWERRVSLADRVDAPTCRGLVVVD